LSHRQAEEGAAARLSSCRQLQGEVEAALGLTFRFPLRAARRLAAGAVASVAGG